MKHNVSLISLVDESNQCYNPFTVNIFGQVKLDFFENLMNELPCYLRFNPLLNLSWEFLIGHFVVDNGTI